MLGPETKSTLANAQRCQEVFFLVLLVASSRIFVQCFDGANETFLYVECLDHVTQTLMPGSIKSLPEVSGDISDT